MSHLRKQLLTSLLLLCLVSAMGLRCHDDSQIIDRHQQKLDQEDE